MKCMKCKKVFRKFYVVAWVHPKSGGDDYRKVLSLDATSEKDARDSVEYWLKRRSAVTSDYAFISAERFRILVKSEEI